MLDISQPIPTTLPGDIVFEIIKFLSCYMRLVDRDQRERTRKDSLCFEPTSKIPINVLSEKDGHSVFLDNLGWLDFYFHGIFTSLDRILPDLEYWLSKSSLYKISIIIRPGWEPSFLESCAVRNQRFVHQILGRARHIVFGFRGYTGKYMSALVDLILSGVYPNVTTIALNASMTSYIPSERLSAALPNLTKIVQHETSGQYMMTDKNDPVHWRKIPQGYLTFFPKLEALDISETIEDVLPSIKTVRFDGCNSKIELHAFPSATTYIASCHDLTSSVFENLSRLGLGDKDAKIVVCTDFRVDSALFSAEEKSPIFNGKIEVHIQMNFVFVKMSMLELERTTEDKNAFLQNMERFMKNNGIQHLVLRCGLEEVMDTDYVKTRAKWCMEHKHPELTISIVCGCCNGLFTS